MGWGPARTGVDDLVAKIEKNVQTVMYLLPIRKISTSDACRLAQALENNTVLTEFYASGHSIGLEAFQAFAKMLERNSTLTKLCIGDSTMGDEGVAALCSALEVNKGLLELDLEQKGFGAVGIHVLSKALAKNTTLRCLKVSRNALDDESIRILSTGLEKSQIRVLDVSENAFSDDGLQAFIDILANSNLEHLCMVQNDLSLHQKALGKALGATKKLQIVNLESCELTDAFADALSTSCCTISSLNLGRNKLESSAVNLVKSLKHLKQLRLGYNGIGDASAVELGVFLRENPHSIELLDLSANALTETSIDVLFQNIKVDQLRLFENQLKNGASNVAERLTRNSSLKVLDLGANELHGTAASAIFEALKDNTTLRVLEMGGNDLQDVGQESLQNLQRLNPSLDVAIDKKGNQEANN